MCRTIGHFFIRAMYYAARGFEPAERAEEALAAAASSLLPRSARPGCFVPATTCPALGLLFFTRSLALVVAHISRPQARQLSTALPRTPRTTPFPASPLPRQD